MKKAICILLVCLFVLGGGLPCFAAEEIGTTYYVDADGGNDSASGLSERSAWKSLAKASEQSYRPGDKILLKAGAIFNGTFQAKGNGTAQSPITLGAYGDTDASGLPIVRSDNDVVLICLSNVSHWIAEELELTAPNGHGIVVEAANSVSVEDVTVRKCVFHDITNKALVTRYPILLTSSGSARLNRITVQSCNIYDCGYGIAMGGLSREWAPNEFINPEQSYNKDYLIEDVHMNHLLYDGIIIMSVYGMVIRNCSLLNTCLLDDHPTAPMWSHHASNFIIENCEIAGAVNEKDGMAVDFDGWTTDAVYQYCYSHDNVRFIRNCCYDNYTCNDNCTVRYCLSVNDNQGDNSMAQLLSSSSLDYKPDEAAQYMTNFKFYNNTVVNASEFNLIGLKNAYIANNIFTGDLTTSFRFARKTFDGNGNKTVLRFDGTMKNNCFWGTSVPSISTDNLVRNPRFVGTDETDPNSFKLADSSPLIGKGVFVCTDMGECDFYGNKLTKSLNIGCYGGEGEAAKTTVRPFGDLLALCNSVLGIIYNFIYTCNDLYWIF